jgi:hypothetical protein
MNQLRNEISPLKERLIDHPLYGYIKTTDHLKVFMEHHVFAVWDFMSLLKTLQQRLTCVEVPWVPKGNAVTRRLINEIVAVEESDIDPSGNSLSHFELYLKAMREIGCDMRPINCLLFRLVEGDALSEALNKCNAPHSAIEFVKKTFEVIHSSKTHVQAAAFTFGREDLVPGMFLSFVRELSDAFPERVSAFRFYLERHIAVDGDSHSHLALQMTNQLCDVDLEKWSEATLAAKDALNCRIEFWNRIQESLLSFPASQNLLLESR